MSANLSSALTSQRLGSEVSMGGSLLLAASASSGEPGGAYARGVRCQRFLPDRQDGSLSTCTKAHLHIVQIPRR